jgi:putative membrane protein
MTDLVLAFLHHVLAFGMVAVLASEIATIRPGLTAAGVRRLTVIDAHYGVMATLLIVIGILRVLYGMKGSDFYVVSPFFWAKMSAFAIVAALSAVPTLRIIAWRRMAKADPAYIVPVEETRRVRPFLLAEAAVFVFIPLFAAAMARIAF